MSTNQRTAEVTETRGLSLEVNEMLVADDIGHIHGCPGYHGLVASKQSII